MSVQEVIHNNELAETVFKALSMRERFRQVTDLRRLYNEVDKLTHGKAEPEEFNKVIKNMEQAGLGRFIAGRKNQPDRFKWANKGIAKAIKEGNLEDPKPEITKSTASASALQNAEKETFQEAIGVITEKGAVTYLNIKIPLSIPLDQMQAFINAIKALKA
jgi:hypothetical protein